MTKTPRDRPAESDATSDESRPNQELTVRDSETPASEWDLSDEDPGPAPTPPTTAAYDPAPAREVMRGRLAGGLTCLLAILVLASPIALAFGATVDDLTNLLQVVLPPVVALTGTALGFYFGGADRSSS